VNPKPIVATVLAKAKKYRNLIRLVDDDQTQERAMELIEEMERLALALAKLDEDHVRPRAREIWEENGRPSGRDLEFWYQAEQEFREAEALAARERREQDSRTIRTRRRVPAAGPYRSVSSGQSRPS
jgi:hypothetical protein